MSKSQPAAASQIKPLSLGQRYKKIHDAKTEVATMDAFRQLTFEQMGQQTVNFGKTTRGRSFLDVIENETLWCKWVADHLHTSPQIEHRTFLKAEETERALLKTDPQDPDSPKPSGTDLWDMIVENSEMDATVNALTSQVGDMQSRMTRMESVLEQLVQALNKQTPSQS